MRDEIQRISKLVADGKLSPEDAADLIDAFYASERSAEQADLPPNENADYAQYAEYAKFGGTDGSVPPPPPPGTPGGPGSPGVGSNRDPLKSIVESIEKLTKEGIDSVNWTEVSKQARTSAKKGFEALRAGIEDISKGKVNIGWMFTSEEREVILPLSVGLGKTLKIENLCGDVKLTGSSEAGKVRALARFKGQTNEDAKAKADAYTLIIEESDHMVLIRQPDVSGLHVDLTIELVGKAPIEVRAENGDVQVVGTGQSCRVNGKNGNIVLRGLDGVVEIVGETGDVTVEDTVTPSLTIENKNGNIKGSKIRGNATLRTATGDIDLDGISGRTLSVESVSGDIDVRLSEPITSAVNVRTVSGDVKIEVPEGSDCRLSLSTLRGDVSCDLEMKDEAKQDQRITGRIGAGSGTLDVSSVTGNVAVTQKSAVAS